MFCLRLLRPAAMPLIFDNVSSTCFNPSLTIKFKICVQQRTWNILYWSSFICQYRFNLDTTASLLEALSNVIVNILSRMPKFVKVYHLLKMLYFYHSMEHLLF